MREIVAQDLRERGFEVIEAGCGDDALLGFIGGGFDLLVTDISMPGATSGWDLAELCREHHPKLPVVYMTGFSKAAARQVSGSFVLYKPFDLDTLSEAIERVISYRQAGI